MAEDHEFEELQVRVSELERLVKHQGEQLAIHAENVEKHGARVAQMAETNDIPKQLRNAPLTADERAVLLPLTVAAEQAAGQSSGKLGAFS